MQTRLLLRNPILLAVGMIVILIALSVGWVVMAARSAMDHTTRAPMYWTLLTVGSLFFILMVVGVVLYLTLSIKAINLSRRQSNFIDSVTHELKSPIASLKLYLQTLNRHPTSPEEREEFYRSMLDDVERLDQLINHVLDAARLDRPVSDRSKHVIAMDELLRECAHEVCKRYRLPTSTIKMELSPCKVEGWRVDLELIFKNLMDNALKYAGDPPDVTVVLDREITGKTRVRVTDNGQGIPHKFRQKVFSRFVRLGTELEREKQGLGLGLFIVRTLVSRLRGRVRVRSRDGVNGSTFEVVLPSWPSGKPGSPDPNSEAATTSAV